MPFLGQTQRKLLQHSGVQRMPTTQREWNDFIQNLDVFLQGETDAFTPTFGTGFSTDPVNAAVYWKKVGTIVIMSFANSAVGTSDTTSFSITGIPARLQPISSGSPVQFSVPIVGLVDNDVESWGSVIVTNAGTIVFGFEDTQATTWTGSGGKGFNASGSTYPTIIYDTRFTQESP